MADGQSTIQGILCEGVLVLVQSLFESLAIHFIVEGIRLTQDLLISWAVQLLNNTYTARDDTSMRGQSEF